MNDFSPHLSSSAYLKIVFFLSVKAHLLLHISQRHLFRNHSGLDTFLKILEEESKRPLGLGRTDRGPSPANLSKPPTPLRGDLSRSGSPGRSFDKEKSPFLEAKTLLRPTPQSMRSDGGSRGAAPPGPPEWKAKGGQLRNRQTPLSLQGSETKHKAGTSVSMYLSREHNLTHLLFFVSLSVFSFFFLFLTFSLPFLFALIFSFIFSFLL